MFTDLNVIFNKFVKINFFRMISRGKRQAHKLLSLICLTISVTLNLCEHLGTAITYTTDVIEFRYKKCETFYFSIYLFIFFIAVLSFFDSNYLKVKDGSLKYPW